MINHTEFYCSLQARGAMLMFVAAFLTFMAIGGFPSFVEDMKVRHVRISIWSIIDCVFGLLKTNCIAG